MALIASWLFPVTLQMAQADRTQQREMLRKFYSEGRFADITLRTPVGARDDRASGDEDPATPRGGPERALHEGGAHQRT